MQGKLGDMQVHNDIALPVHFSPDYRASIQGTPESDASAGRTVISTSAPVTGVSAHEEMCVLEVVPPLCHCLDCRSFSRKPYSDVHTPHDQTREEHIQWGRRSGSIGRQCESAEVRALESEAG